MMTFDLFQKINKQSILVLISSVAGMLFQLVLSYMLSIFLGSFVFQIMIIFSISIFSMGIGSLLSEKIKNAKKFFLMTQMMMSLFSLALVPLIIFFNHFIFENYFFVLIYFIPLATGIISGSELPLIMNIQKKENINNQSESMTNHFISNDYIGMGLAVALFTFLLLPLGGIVLSVMCMTSLYVVNIGILENHKPKKYLIFTMIALINLPVFYLKLEINDLMQGWILN